MSANESLDIVINGERAIILPETLEKYNQPGPRYTSYPTAPEWDDSFGPDDLRASFEEAENKPDPAGLSLYFHLPFCEALCLFCGCNVVINKKHEVTIPYLANIKKEINWVGEQISPKRTVEQLHWGGGTPTYLLADQIEELFSHIREHFSFSPIAEIGIEVDPRVTSQEQCRVLRKLGFNRISMGVQDFNQQVQETIHRVQPYEMTKELFDYCRELGFESINIDLIYGLPHQTRESFRDTVDKLIAINPDRIALFSYAHVPWMKKQQGSFANFLPEGLEKFRIFRMAIEKLVDAGYVYIGLDHFARPDDELCRAQADRTLHRNFQGYTTKGGSDLYGMGVSSISGLEDVYSQNWRDLPHYYEAIEANRWPTMRGMRVSKEDKLRRSVINRILCHTVVVKSEIEKEFDIDFDKHFGDEITRLRELEKDNLVTFDGDRIQVAVLGRIFIRNIAMVFDTYLKKPKTMPLFSKTL